MFLGFRILCPSSCSNSLLSLLIKKHEDSKVTGRNLNFQFNGIVISLGESISHLGTKISRPSLRSQEQEAKMLRVGH